MRETIRKTLAHISLWAMGLCLTTLVSLDFWQVIQRYALGQSWPWAGDVSVILLLTLAWIGAGYLWLVNGHIAVDFLPLKDTQLNALKTVFDGVVLIGGVVLIPMTWDTMQAYSFIDLPTLPVSGSIKYVPVAVGLGFLTLAAALTFLKHRE